MSRSRFARGLLPLTFLLAVSAGAQPGAPAPRATTHLDPDASLYLQYHFYLNSINFALCGTLPGTDGCYTQGYLQPLADPGAMLEGTPVVNDDLSTSSHTVYVVDQAADGGTQVNLVVFRIGIVVNGGDAQTTVTTLKTIPLPLTGGSDAHTFMAANAKYLFIGTDQGGKAVRVSKANYAVTDVAGFTPALNVSSITADPYGYVDVTFGSLNGADGVHAYDPSGTSLGLHHGAAFKLGTGQSLATSDVLPRDGAVVPDIVHYHPTGPATAATNANPDAGLSIDFGFNAAFTSVNYAVCGSVAGSNGCYGSGTLDTFGHVGAMLQGNPNVDAANGIVRRDVYVLDEAVGGGASTSVALDVYRVTEKIVAPNVVVTTKKLAAIPLSLVGGIHARTMMAANGHYLFIGTNHSGFGEFVNKATFAVSTTDPHSYASPLQLVTIDHQGDVLADFSFAGDPNGGLDMYDNQGNLLEFGGGSNDFLIGTVQGLSTADIYASNRASAARR